MAKPPPKSYTNETLGALQDTILRQDSRIKQIEEKINVSAWEKHFNQKPFVILGGVFVIFIGAFWSFYTWDSDRRDKKLIDETNKIKEEYESRIKWINEKHASELLVQKKECDIDNKIEKNRICENFSDKKHTSPKSNVSNIAKKSKSNG